MCIKDMPSVALGCIDKSVTDQMNLDFVLDGVVDDRIEAAYAIVELGERGPMKGAEFPLMEEENLGVDDTEQYQQVPRSPECLRECRRGALDRSADASPVRGKGRPLECHIPKIVHVKGAVMPTRATGIPVQKLTLKRRQEDEAVSGGIKAKLARMLIERKFSHEEAGKSSPEAGICQKNGSANDSDEEQNTVSTRGRFVRTSVPVIQPIISHIQSATNFPKEIGNLEVKTEQSVSAAEINKHHGSFQETLINEQVVFLDNSRHKIVPQGASSHSFLKEVSNFKLNEVLRDHNICSSEVSSKDVNVTSSLHWTPDSSVPGNGRDTVLSEHLSTSGRGVSVIKSDIEAQPARNGHCFFLGPADDWTSTSGTAGLLQYYMLPVMKSLPNAIKSEFCGIQPAVGCNADALKRLEQLSLGKGYCREPALKSDLVVPETQQSSWNVDRYHQLYGSLNSISGQNGMSSSPISEAGNPLSGLIEALSLQNLPGALRVSPSSRKQLHPLKQRDVVNESKKLQNIENEPVRYRTQKSELKATKPRSKISAIADALEMVKGGEFGSLRTIRNLYNRMKSRNIADSSAYFLQNTQCSKLPLKTERQSFEFEEQEQVMPLDLSRYRRRMSYQPTEPKVKVKSCHSYPQSFETFPSPDLCRKETCDSYSEAAIESHIMHSDILSVKADATVNSDSDSAVTRLADDKNNRDSDNYLTGSSNHPVPNSHLPPKKRKFYQTSKDVDSSESKTLPNTKSTSTNQESPDEQESYTHQISAKSGDDQTLETPHQRKISETDAKLLPDDIASEESILSAVAIRDEDGDLPLHITVAQGSVDVVQKLLRVMAKVGLSVDICNNNRQTALHLAVISNQTQMVELLLKESASANVCDRKGNTAVHLAVKYKSLPCLKKILEDSRIPLDLDARNYEGLTALHIGVQLSQPDAVEALLISGANPNTMDGTNGRTPLFNAVESNDFIIASTLIQHGSDPYIASYSGCMPLQIATGKSLREMIGMLEKSGKEWFRRIQDSN